MIRRRGAAAVLLAMLAACGGGGGSAGGGGDPPPPLQLATPGVSVIKLRSGATSWVALAEKARSPEIPTKPQRQLLISQADGRSLRLSHLPPDGWSLLDFALHASGEISLLLASDRELRLQRLSAIGQPLRDQPFVDLQVATDAFVGDPLSGRDHQSLLPHYTRDAARLAAIGEDVALAFRSGRHAVVLHRLAYTATDGFAKQWRRLVEPGVFIGARFITSGTFDPFKSLDQQWRVALDADAQGRIAVAVSLHDTDLLDGHRQHFGEALDPAVANGLLLSQFNGSGQRLGTALIDTRQRSELHALRWVGDQVAVAGRVRTLQTPEGWDGFLALVPAGATAASAYRVLHADAGDVVFDVALRSDGRLLVAGSTGYTQNPAGASISEDAKPLLGLLSADGQWQQRITLVAGPRHNQLRALASRADGSWLLGGMDNGPGTHSADANTALLTADGYLREQRL
ncbi:MULTISPECIES: hypothetical protein [unclassified Roseateles]|uniref:hypothetical protein n=1 Tax=unclassified Roseateles TaxID=2626991 RepID=UPI0007015FFC|nr:MULTISPECIES: hypothetical protein [unclassified Roseateles]KQW51423.1 hypothetical protein ASC81_01905 [Pelomonas sp. Root405]KRA77655.1 hypothetical protein ASD88_01905 [Pelomonas sp. Root662]